MKSLQDNSSCVQHEGKFRSTATAPATHTFASNSHGWMIDIRIESSWVSVKPIRTRQRNRKLVCKAAPQFISRQRYKVALYFVQFNWFNAVWLHKTSPEVLPCIDVIQLVRSVFGRSKAEHTENLNRNQNLEQVNGQIIKTSKWTRKVDSFDRSFGFSKSQVTCGVCAGTILEMMSSPCNI